MNQKYYTVYKTTNLLSGKFYMGLHTTENPYDDYLGSGVHLNHAIKKYGKDNFKKEVIKVCETEEEMIVFESLIVDEANTSNPNCYNIALGGGKPPIMCGDSNPMKRPEVIEKVSKAMKGNRYGALCKHDDEWRRKVSVANKGKKRSVETKRRCSEAAKRRINPPRSEEAKARMRIAQQKSWAIRKTHSQKTKSLLSKLAHKQWALKKNEPIT